MAIEIRSIPVLTGETAQRFVCEADNSESSPKAEMRVTFADVDRVMENARQYLREHGGKTPFDR